MSRRCAVCGRGPTSGNNVSHSEVKTRRRWLINLQPVRMLQEGTTRRVLVCTRCLRSGKVVRAV
ncbi:MAG: 50S ribosomal protein L28 [Limnochordaceae bacterium]|nr:50S ribosomal protein L28 [Limnochordaceae bacterium]